MKSELCSLLKIDIPIIQAPIGPAAGPRLAAAVSNAGGLGTLALAGYDSESARRLVQETRASTQRPFSVNFVLSQPFNEALDVCLEEGVPVISLFWGDVAGLVERIHSAGAHVILQVGDKQEAKIAAEAGVDIILAQGWEAGGHVRGDIATLPLIPSVVDAVTPLPVVAAGGIADGRGLAAVLALGAAGAWIGTRFLASDEAPVHPHYRKRIFQGTGGDTVHTTLFDVGWRNAPHRVLRNSTFTEWENAGRPPSGQRPGEGDVVAHDALGRPVPRYGFFSAVDGHDGDIEAFPLWSGQAVDLVLRQQPASEIVREIAEEAEATLSRLADDMRQII